MAFYIFSLCIIIVKWKSVYMKYFMEGQNGIYIDCHIYIWTGICGC